VLISQVSGASSSGEQSPSEGHRSNVGLSSTGIAAGTSIPIDLMKRLVNEMNLTELTVAYGMST